jgi:hypothetical protein
MYDKNSLVDYVRTFMRKKEPQIPRIPHTSLNTFCVFSIYNELLVAYYSPNKYVKDVKYTFRVLCEYAERIKMAQKVVFTALNNA